MSPHLFFTVQCGPALAFDTERGLGRVAEQLRYGVDGMPPRERGDARRAMHARFEGPGVLFFASYNDDAEPMRGYAMILMMEDRSRTEQLFGSLGQGGQVTTPWAVQPWGGLYSKLTDRFGVQWMLNCRAAG